MHVVHERREASSLRNRSFGRVVGVVDVEVGCGTYAYHGIAVWTDPGVLPRKELHVAVRTHMYHCIGAPHLLVIVVGGQILVRWRTERVVEYLAHLSVAPRAVASPLGLYSYGDVAEHHSCDQYLTVQDHALARRLPPGLDHLLAELGFQGIEELHVLLDGHPVDHSAAAVDLLDGGPSEFGYGLPVEDGLDEFLPVRWRVDGVSRFLHPPHDVGHALVSVQMRCAAHVCFHARTGVVVQEEYGLPFGCRFPAQFYALPHALGQ